MLAGCSNERRTGADQKQLRHTTGGAAQEIISVVERKTGPDGKFLVAFVGVENRSQWTMGASMEMSYQEIDTEFVNSGLFRMISRRQVEQAKRTSGLQSVDQLFLPEFRKPYVESLGTFGLSPDYLMWGVFTSLDDQTGARNRSSDYQLTLEIIDALTGEIVAKSSFESKGQ